MTRIAVLVVAVAALFTLATCFTTTTTQQTTSKYCNNKRKRDFEGISPINVFVTRPQPILSFRTSTTSLFEGKDLTSLASSILDGVVELGESTAKEDETKSSPGLVEQAVAPFFSQGEIDPQSLNPDLSDPKQARVIIYIILSLVPVLFLIPLMIGSRDLIPLDAVSPVQL